jgi:hypothetical protein
MPHKIPLLYKVAVTGWALGITKKAAAAALAVVTDSIAAELKKGHLVVSKPPAAPASIRTILRFHC